MEDKSVVVAVVVVVVAVAVVVDIYFTWKVSD